MPRRLGDVPRGSLPRRRSPRSGNIPLISGASKTHQSPLESAPTLHQCTTLASLNTEVLTTRSTENAPAPRMTRKATIASTNSAAVDIITGCRRSNCFTRPDLRPTKMTFIRIYSSKADAMLTLKAYVVEALRLCPATVGRLCR